MNHTIHILQVGPTDWSKSHIIPEDVEWNYLPCDAKMIPEEIKENKYDATVIEGKVERELLSFLYETAQPYTCFYTEQYIPDQEGVTLLKHCYARKIIDIEGFLRTVPLRLFKGQEGYKMQVKDMEFTEHFKSNARFIGENHIEVSVNEDGFKQIAFLRYNTPLNLYGRRVLELWPEYQCRGNVRLQYKIKLHSLKVNAMPVWKKTIEGEALDEPVLITETDKGYLSVSIFACGSGTVELGPVHVRHSRMGLGQFLPGGKRHVDSSRGELISYFHPGDFKPPLMVYFSGYRTAEGFEGNAIMRSLGTPFLLLGDPRLEGGAFYTGNQDFEDRVNSVIQDVMERLHFRKDQVVFSGLSMGTYGAVYYGCKFLPKAIVIGKPLMSMGSIADNERKNRMGQFETSLDYLLRMTGGMKTEHVAELNDRMWKRFDKADFSQTQFSIAYMLQDDYDSTAYADILSHLEEKNISVVGKGIEGRHNDNTSAIVHWFMGQLRRILREEFRREVE